MDIASAIADTSRDSRAWVFSAILVVELLYSREKVQFETF